MIRANPQSQLREEYNAFVGGISFTHIRLIGCSVESNAGRPSPSKTNITVNFETLIHEITSLSDPTAFESVASIEVAFTTRETAEEIGRIRASYLLGYTSSINADEKVIQLFVKQNVPINAWPYLREFVHATLQRMGWASFVLPPLRPGQARKKTSRASSSKKALPANRKSEE